MNLTLEVNLTDNEIEQIKAITDMPEYEGYIKYLSKLLGSERAKCSKVGISERDADVHRGQARRLEKLIGVREKLIKIK